jgi:HEAT repeat protein
VLFNFTGRFTKQKVEGIMKTLLLIITVVTFFVLPESSFAAKHDSLGGMESLQPLSPSDQFPALSEDAGGKDIAILLQKLGDPDPFVRVEVVQALGEIQREQSLVSVCNCLGDENLYVRAYAAEAVGKIGQVDISLALSHLLVGLDDPSPYVRAMMVAALGELQDERAVDSLRRLLHDDDESVRGMAAWALNRIETAQN